MWERLQRLRALEAQARGILLSAAALLPFLFASLRLRGFRKTQAFLRKHLSPSGVPAEVEAAAQAALTTRLVRAAARYGVGHPTCLEESLALWWLLSRQGIDCELRIGVRKHDDKFEAHAWVEREGAALNEPQALHEHYAAFDTALASLLPGPQ